MILCICANNSTSNGPTVWRTTESPVFGQKLVPLSRATQVFILSFYFLHWQHSVWHKLMCVSLCECASTVVCHMDSMFIFFDFRWLCVTTSILTTLLCWLHVCFPQAAVRGQKGEKGEPAVLEPVSYWLILCSFTWAGVFKVTRTVTEMESFSWITYPRSSMDLHQQPSSLDLAYIYVCVCVMKSKDISTVGYLHCPIFV